MPLMSSSVSVGANATSTNQVQGQLEEFVTRPSTIRLAAVMSATGLNCTLVVGRTVLYSDQLLPAIGTTIAIPDHVIAEQTVNRGRMILTFRNTTGGALTAVWRIDVIPL